MTIEKEKGGELRIVGTSVTKIDALGLACGRGLYTADIASRGDCLVGKILRSPHAHARIVSIDATAARKIPGVHAVLTHHDVPRNVYTSAGQGFPEPSPYDTFVLDNKVRYVGDRVALVAAETEELALEAMAAIVVEYEVLEAVFEARSSMAVGTIPIHDEPEARMPIPVQYEPSKNLAARVEFDIGDVRQGFAASAHVFDEEFETVYASHCAIEPHIAYCYFDAQDRLVIVTSTQVPFHCRRIVAHALGIPIRRIRVVKPRIGGGFGGKQEVLVEPLCAALALATSRPVLLELTREEVFVSSPTRHPQIINVAAGITAEGSISAIDLRVLMNTGAYGGHALTVMCNSGSKVLPLFNKVPHLHFLGESVYTNLPVGGAYRGYGATQSYFALGVILDEMAEAVGLDILDLYRREHIREGETSKVFEILGEGRAGVVNVIESCKLDECIERGAQAIGWSEKRGRKIVEGHWHHGVGMVCLMQGSSIPEVDMASAYIKMNEDGSFNLQVGATDLGTGSDTVLAQIAAEVLHVDEKHIIVYSSDTDLTPFDVGAYASSTTYLSGAAVQKAAGLVATKILHTAAELLHCDVVDLELVEGAVRNRRDGETTGFDRICLYSLYHYNQFQIAAEASSISHKSPPPFAAHFAEVAVDPETGLVRVVTYIAAVDCGTAINPVLAEGQTEGAVINGIGYALTERYIFSEKGRMMNPSFNYYKVPGTADIPRLETILVESWEPSGPFGAKSVSEISINGPLPAISNAIYDAVGVRMRKAPFTPDTVLEAIRKKHAADG